VFCVINATINTLTERFIVWWETHVKLVGCLFIIQYFNYTFEYKEGIIQIMVYSSVIDINQTDVIFFAIKIIKLITSG